MRGLPDWDYERPLSLGHQAPLPPMGSGELKMDSIQLSGRNEA